jgi:hypothetical protein
MADAALAPYAGVGGADAARGGFGQSRSIEQVVAEETARTCAFSHAASLRAVADVFDAQVRAEELR